VAEEGFIQLYVRDFTNLATKAESGQEVEAQVQRRVREAREAMFAGDPDRLGSVMTAAHASERDDFECSIEEIDFLVETAVGLSGCYGARLTGGGFGGCTVNLVDTAAVDEFIEALTAAYRARFALKLDTYVCAAVDGALARNTAQLGSNPREAL